jgi:hypothetical protein
VDNAKYLSQIWAVAPAPVKLVVGKQSDSWKKKERPWKQMKAMI